MSDPNQDAYRQAQSRGEGSPLPRDDEPKVASFNPDGSIEVSKGGRTLATIRPATVENLGAPTVEVLLAPVAATDVEAIAVAIGIPGAKVSKLNGRIFAALEGEVRGEWISRSVPVDPTNVGTARSELERWMQEVEWPR